jgi:hypothetical protein
MLGGKLGRLLVGAACLAFAGGALAAPLTAPQRKRISALVDQSLRMQRAEQPVRAYLYLTEAFRLEQLWRNNIMADDSLAETQLERYTRQLLQTNDGSLMRILHSTDVPMNDKLNLIRALEQDVIMNHPSQRGADELLGGFDE